MLMIMFSKNIEIFSISLICTFDIGDPRGQDINLSKKFLLGKKIAHVWEKVESIIISILYVLVPVRRLWKKSQ